MENPYIIYLDRHMIVIEVAHTFAAINKSATPMASAASKRPLAHIRYRDSKTAPRYNKNAAQLISGCTTAMLLTKPFTHNRI